MNGSSPAPGPVVGGIQISPRPGLRLHPGEIVLLSVIKQLGPGKWAVGIGGRVYPAFSQLVLQPGSVLRARVGSAAGRLILTLSDQRMDPVRMALQREGLPASATTETIARALAMSGLPIHAETVERVRVILEKSRLPLRRGARLVATLIDKGIDPSSRGAEALMAVLAFGERGGGDPRRYRGRPFPDTAGAVKKLAAEMAVPESAKPASLQAFNHIRGRAQTWVVIPFLFDEGEERMAGTIRLLYDPFLKRPLKLAMVVGGISFFLPLEGKSRRLSIFCDDPRLRGAAARGLDSLRAKFHNKGMEVDDTILEGEAFDGFSPIGEGANLPSIDVVG